MTSMALFPYPSRFHGDTSGCMLPAASVARARSVCRPTAPRVPAERPVLPVVRTAWEVAAGGVPVALTGEADLDAGDRSGPGPCLAADGAGPDVDGRPRARVGDPRAHAHEVDGLVGPVRPLVHVVAGLELAGERLGEHLDPLEPFHRGDRVPVRHDDAEGAPWSGPRGCAVHLVGDQDPRSAGRRRGPAAGRVRR